MIDEKKARDIIAYLNDLHKQEPYTLQRLITARVPCGAGFVRHASLQVVGPKADPQIGFLGVMNGFCGTYDDGKHTGRGPIAALFDKEGVLQGFGLTHEVHPEENKG